MTPTHADIAAIEALLGEPATRIVAITGGGNSRLWRVEMPTRPYVAKFYTQTTADGACRLSVEFAALQFLRDQGMSCVPQALACDQAHSLALYEFIDGSAVTATDVDAALIDQMTGFIAALCDFATVPAAAVLPPAAEARFSLAAVVENIQTRLTRLREVGTTSTAHETMQALLRTRVEPLLAQKSTLAIRSLGAAGFSTELPLAARTLSPSDLGFHNALLRPDGRLCFLDFEYFGWDDPAKTVADFLLHPRHTFDDALKRRYVQTLLQTFGATPGFAARLAAAYPLFGIKWSLILLNEFVPAHLRRRQFAQNDGRPLGEVLAAQLAKAEYTLDCIAHDTFPYAEFAAP